MRLSIRCCIPILAMFAALALLPVAASATSTPEQTADEEAGEEKAKPETEPADGAALSRPARSLRVFLPHTPNVEKSSLTLEGPAGALEVQGLHTMGSDDLMARVVGAMPDGEYVATWTTDDPAGGTATGSWKFTIKRSASKP